MYCPWQSKTQMIPLQNSLKQRKEFWNHLPSSQRRYVSFYLESCRSICPLWIQSTHMILEAWAEWLKTFNKPDIWNTNRDTSSLEFCRMSGIVPIPITGLEVPASSLARTFLLESHLTSLRQLLNPVIDHAHEKSICKWSWFTSCLELMSQLASYLNAITLFELVLVSFDACCLPPGASSSTFRQCLLSCDNLNIGGNSCGISL
jgi:hypothetical protein